MSSPVKSLYKLNAGDMSTMDKIEAFIIRYAYILLPICLIVLLFLIIALVIVAMDISSASTPVMVESGNYYNHFKDVI